MTAPRYALMSALAFDRLPRAQLDELLAEVQARPPFDGYWVTITGIPGPTNADKARALRHAHQAWLDAAHAAAPPRAGHAGTAKPARPAPTRTQGGPAVFARPSPAVSLQVWQGLPLCPACHLWVPLGHACPDCGPASIDSRPQEVPAP